MKTVEPWPENRRMKVIGTVNLAGPWMSGNMDKGRKVVEKDVKHLRRKRNLLREKHG